MDVRQSENRSKEPSENGQSYCVHLFHAIIQNQVSPYRIDAALGHTVPTVVNPHKGRMVGDFIWLDKVDD